MLDTGPSQSARAVARRRVFWASVWLGVVLIALKAYYLGLPGAPHVPVDKGYLRSLAAISYVDGMFVAVWWAVGRLVLGLTGDRPAARAVSAAFVVGSAILCLYGTINIIVFGIFGGFITYPLLMLIGNVRMLSSSVGAYVTAPNVLKLTGIPLAFLLLVAVSLEVGRRGERGWRRRSGPAFTAALLLAWLAFGRDAYADIWATRQERRVAESAHWVILSSWWQAVSGDGVVRMSERFDPADLTDFDPIGALTRSSPAIVRASSSRGLQNVAPRKAPHVILIVLESVAARWTGLNGGPYASTPAVEAESTRGVVFENIYAHIGRSSNSLAAMLLSTYPRLSFREATEEYPDLAITSLPALFRSHGYRTAFLTPSDLSWAGWGPFLSGRGFDELRDYHRLPCTMMISSWGVEDRCMIDGIIDLIARRPAQPLFLMGWTTQTHHPYEPTPGTKMLSLLQEHTPDDYDLWKYLNVLHETDRHLGRLFDAIRRAGLDHDTIVVVTGDHGQAFGYPHDSWFQGKTVYEEDVHVPFMIWDPRRYQSGVRSDAIGSHVDLAPTLTDLAGLPPAPEWQGRSLFDRTRMPRAYFYVAEDHFTLGVRENDWKYIFDLREGTDELYDLDHDPTERQNLVKAQPERANRLRQRLAAWAEANRRQYAPSTTSAARADADARPPQPR